MKSYRILLLIVVGLLPTLSGCASSGGNSAIRYYVVDPIEAMPVRSSEQPLVVEIVDLHLPQYLERYQIATRSSAHQLLFSESHQWSENLRKNLMRTLARNLARALNTEDISTPLARSASPPDYRVQLSIESFELRTDGDVGLDARWQVTGTGGKTLLTRGAELRGAPTAPSYAGVVAQMGMLFGELSRRIARSLLDQSSNGGSG